MLACHAGGPGSIPGRCKAVLFLSGHCKHPPTRIVREYRKSHIKYIACYGNKDSLSLRRELSDNYVHYIFFFKLKHILRENANILRENVFPGRRSEERVTLMVSTYTTTGNPIL